MTENSDIYALKRSIWWKVYFFIWAPLAVLVVFSLIFPFFRRLFLYDVIIPGVGDYVSALVLFISLIGLFGYVFLKQILSPIFWLIFSLVFILFNVFLFDLLLSEDAEPSLLEDAIGLLTVIPHCFALISYGRKSNPIWLMDSDKDNAMSATSQWLLFLISLVPVLIKGFAYFTSKTDTGGGADRIRFAVEEVKGNYLGEGSG